MNKTLAVIPARGGSKRIPGKNIRPFLGKPIITYSVHAALHAHCFEEIMVSTDDNAIARIAIEEGARIPFLRSQQAADDHAPLATVLLEVLDCYKAVGRSFDYICCILPTAPMISSEDILNGFTTLAASSAEGLVSVVRFSYPIQRALLIENGRIAMVWPENTFIRSNDLEARFHDAGQFYWLKTEPFLKQKTVFVKNMLPIELPELRVQDIDTEEDWRLAEFKYQFTRGIDEKSTHNGRS